MVLEICANSFQSAKNAQDAGAHRIELCSELAAGGITPSYGLIKQVLENLSIETYVLIRPRSGNFSYSDSEFEIMKQDIQVCKDLGCSGIVSGILKADYGIDVLRTQEIIALSKPLSFTFHRAFDCLPNPLDTLYQLMNLGVDRILTSGHEVTAIQGMEFLNQLKEKSEGNVIILPGSGINPTNAKAFKDAGFNEIHASASKLILDKNINSYFGNTQNTVSDFETIKAILKQIE